MVNGNARVSTTNRAIRDYWNSPLAWLRMPWLLHTSRFFLERKTYHTKTIQKFLGFWYTDLEFKRKTDLKLAIVLLGAHDCFSIHLSIFQSFLQNPITKNWTTWSQSGCTLSTKFCWEKWFYRLDLKDAPFDPWERKVLLFSWIILVIFTDGFSLQQKCTTCVFPKEHCSTKNKTSYFHGIFPSHWRPEPEKFPCFVCLFNWK